MAEYIDRKKLLERLVKEYPHQAPHGAIVVGMLCDEEPADVRPVVRGRWEWRHRHRGSFRRVTGEDDFGISHTITIDERYEIDDPYCPYCGKLNESVFLNFCPNCGADMREEENDVPDSL